MSLQPPSPKWQLQKIGKDERIWVYLIILMITMMGVMTVGWLFVGKQNNPEVYYEYDNGDLLIADFAAKNNVDAISIVKLRTTTPADANTSVADKALYRPTGGDVYLYAQRWEWVAAKGSEIAYGLQFKVGERYQLHIGSKDVLHGFQLIGEDFLVALQIVPGYDYVFDFTPNDVGTFRIICNEYCGVGHASMVGFLEVIE